MDEFDGNLETAQMRLRNLAEAACKGLNANTLNVISFHLCAYMDVALKYKGHLNENLIVELAQEQLNAVADHEAERNAGMPESIKRSRRDAGQKPAPPKRE